MRKAIVQPSQTLADIAIQHCGKLEAWSDIARLNGLQLTDAIFAGQVLILPDVIVDKRVFTFLKEGGHAPAVTGVNILEGIDYDGIEYDFVVM
jgi:hypothetical protein